MVEILQTTRPLARGSRYKDYTREQLEQELEWEDRFFANPNFDGNYKLLVRAQRRVERDAHRKTKAINGVEHWHMDWEELAKMAGISADRAREKSVVLSNNQLLSRQEEMWVLQKDNPKIGKYAGEEVPQIYGRLADVLYEHPEMAEKQSNWGGVRAKIHKKRANGEACGGNLIEKDTALVKQKSIECDKCGEKEVLAPRFVSQGEDCRVTRDRQGIITVLPPHIVKAEQQKQVALPDELTEKIPVEPEQQKQLASVPHPPIQWQVTDEEADSAADFSRATVVLFAEKEETPAPSPQETFDRAAALLVEIAGDEPMHAVMNRRDKKGNPQKYGPVYRPLTLGDAREHLRGESTRAARIRRQDGTTRAIFIDRDNAEEMQIAEDAAQLLHCAGYRPLLSPAPACSLHPGGGYLYIIYDSLVDARCAWKHVCEIAPMLADVTEYWPASKQNVRLPGGVYVTPEASEQCTLSDVLGLVADKRKEIAAALLTYQTPAAIVPAYPPDPAPEPKKPATRPAIIQPAAPGAGEISFTAGQLAAWFDDRNRCESILPPAEHGALPRAFPTWREHGPEPHVTIYPENTWCDFGNARDGGDALELYLRTQGVLRGDTCQNCARKKEIMRELGREYRAYLLDQAQHHTVKPGKPMESADTVRGAVPALEMPTAFFAQEERTPAPIAPYDGPYAPPDRHTICCSSGWQWNAAEQRYECAACHPRAEARGSHAA